ncbi:conserved hypothetical protein [Theileria orientalis strain Shintoku]|uniref:Uncharacterized protein n=1 Tax=Theileria orientalis strain Shintoku TaxID=869250 RepID=J7MEK4_THEOR|nr:conserved hypothetical protein [Theileria orientalis strain Shintoku]BAM38619.1 conserved hypothetical protein [Theileria orientalis strain Shintoku]|eukprot:XP_009688920.1 conserved hypothetical protein [Theileria orientalis strain Shintoku]
MKFATVLLFSVEAFLLAKAQRLDFTAKELSADYVDLHTLKDKNVQDSREVKLFASKHSDGFDSVLEGNFVVWGDDSNYKCSYAKVYFKDGKTLGLKLGLVLKTGDHLSEYNTKEAYLRKVGTKWLEINRKVFWDFVKRTYDLNYADKGYETDEEFDPAESSLVIAKPPLNRLKLITDKRPRPHFPLEESKDLPEELEVNELNDIVLVIPPRDESEHADPMSELDKITVPAKTVKPTKDLGEDAHPMSELDKITGPAKTVKPTKDLGEDAHPMSELDKITGPAKTVKPTKDLGEDAHPMSELDEITVPAKGDEKKHEFRRGTPEEKGAKLRKEGDDKSVVVKEVKDGKKSSFLTNSLLLPGILMMLYTFH